MEQAKQDDKKLGTIALTALVIGGIIGSGVFDLPQNMASVAGAGPILIAWVITFFGMLALVRIFGWLSINRSDIDDGVYGYARHGFGNYLGFNAAWGYWMSVWIGNAGYLVIMMATFGAFEYFDFFGDGSTWQALTAELLVLWGVHWFVLRGVRSAAIVNVIVTAAKLVPLALFVVCAILFFKVDVFKINFWGTDAFDGILKQVKDTMLFTVWVFLGIESATVYSTRAKSAKVVSQATLLGFFITVVLMACITILSLGIMPQPELGALKTKPAIADILAAAVGPWGSILIRVGLIISVAGALLAWTLLAAEMIYLSGRGKDHTSPELFGRLNKAQTPAPALWLTNGLISLLLIYNFSNSSGYEKIIQLASSMCLIPYLLCAAFALKETLKGKSTKGMMVGFSALSVVYSVWLIYAGGMNFLLLSMILYAPGLLFYIKASKEKQEAPFPDLLSKLAASLVVILGVVAIYLLLAGTLSLSSDEEEVQSKAQEIQIKEVVALNHRITSLKVLIS